MKILQAHNYYQEPGGEDTVVAAERELLESHGHEVIPYIVHNDAIKEMSAPAAALKTIWNSQTIEQVAPLLAKHKPDVVHAHNTFPLISPALYYAAKRARIPVVQTLHNYRLVCPAALFYRDGHLCEECLGHFPVNSIVHACYRGSRAATATTAAMLSVHRLAGTWNRIDTYIVLSEFAKSRFAKGGLPRDRLIVKPNFLPRDPGAGAGLGHYALFAGRIASYKGVRTLLEAWRTIGTSLPLKVAGDGPLMSEIRAAAQAIPGVEILGACSRPRIFELLQEASVLVFPTELYEGMPMSLLEAYACGTPAIVSNLPSLDDFAQEGANALRFEMGDANSLAAKVRILVNNPQLLLRLRSGARETFCTHFTAEKNYPALMRVYHSTISRIFPEANGAWKDAET